MCCGFEVCADHFSHDACGCPDPGAWQSGQDTGSKVSTNHHQDFSFDIGSLLGQLLELRRQSADDMFSSVGAGHDGGLFG